MKNIYFRIYHVKECISQSRFSTDNLLQKVPKIWTPAISLNENMLMTGGGTSAVQALMDINASELKLNCLNCSFLRENPAFVYIADRMLSKLCNYMMLDQMSYDKSLKKKGMMAIHSC